MFDGTESLDLASESTILSIFFNIRHALTSS